MELEGITADPNQVLVTSGSQQALDVAARVLVNPGDVIFAEAPSYAGGMAVFTSYEAEIVHVSLDADGLIPEELERLIGEVRAAGKAAKGLYTIPNFQKPGGVNLFSKMIAPGLHVGWVLPPASLYAHLVNASETSQLNPSVFSQQFISAYLDDPAWKDKLVEYQGIYHENFTVLVETLEQVMPAGTTWNRPAVAIPS